VQSATRGAPARVSAPRVTGARARGRRGPERACLAGVGDAGSAGRQHRASAQGARMPPAPRAAPLLARARCPADGPARRAQLFDAATVANGSHAPAWHGWGLLEKRQGNLTRARDLWMKARPCPGRAASLHVPEPLLPTQRRPPASPAQCRGAQQPTLSMGEAERSCGARHGRPRCLRTQRSHGGGQEVRSVRAGRACAARRGRRASGGAGCARAGRAQQPAPVPRARRACGRHGPGCRGAALVQRGHAAAAGRQQPRALARVGRHGGVRPALRCAARPQRA